ncbi:MAG: glycosyltransferase family 9 protein [Helicobacteraceae bacterium]|jgi:heptosyltransferase-2/heptosyltransferase-3|nr:glycosyltransferase family 9 protein [Helicobacteraceae bacterium]
MKILLIQLRQLGDVILTSAATRQLRKIYPDAEIVFMSEHLGINAYKFSPRVNRIWAINRKLSFIETIKLFLQVRHEKFDLVIDYFSNPRSAQITFFSGAKERTGFNFNLRKLAYTKSVNIPFAEEYAAKSKIRLIEHLGGDLNDDVIECFIDDNYRKFADEFAIKHKFENRTIALCTVSRREYRVIKPKFWAKIANYLIKKGYKIWFIYGPGEKHYPQKVFDLLEDKNEAIIDHEINEVLQTRAVLEKCLLYMGNDGGNKHLAVTAGIPTITIFKVGVISNWTARGHIGFQYEEGVEETDVIKACEDALKRRKNAE